MPAEHLVNIGSRVYGSFRFESVWIKSSGKTHAAAGIMG
jgi:hypothetical protein